MKKILTHFTAEPLVFDSTFEYTPQNNDPFPFKPDGLWLSDESDYGWKKWCEGEEWGLARLVVETKFECDVSRWCVINNKNHFKEFTALYGTTLGGMSGKLYIDWKKVQKDFPGILITPYQWEMRLSVVAPWYYPWDCASACVWDLSTVKVLK